MWKLCIGLGALLVLALAGQAGAESSPPGDRGSPARDTAPDPARDPEIAAALAAAPRLVVELGTDEDSRRVTRTLRPTGYRAGALTRDELRIPGGQSLSGRIDDPELGLRGAIRIERAPDDSAASIVVEVEHTGTHWSRLIALELDLPAGAPATVIDRSYHPRTVDKTLFLDRFGPKEIRAGGLALLVDDGVDGVAVTRHTPGSVARVELFSVDARPFRHDRRCAQEWRSPNSKVVSSARLRNPGDRDRARVQVALRSAAPGRQEPAPTLVKGRYPDGRSAALVITDHADQSTPAALAALALGSSTARAPVGGLLGHHLTITKSLFFHGDPKRHQLEDPRVEEIAQALHAAGGEVIPHSATPGPDDRDTTRAALDAFSRYGTVTWIDHQPQTNCEAFTNQGFRASGQYRIADLLDAHGYRYIWAAEDAPPGTLDLLGTRLDKRVATVWPLGRLAPGDGAFEPRWMFRSSWMFLETRRFLAALAPDKLDGLERAGGLAILHTYLETLHPGKTKFGLRNLLLRRTDGSVAIDPRFDAVLAELERRVAAGRLWVPTIGVLGDRLRAQEAVSIRYERAGRALVESPVALSGFTLVVPGAPAGAEVRVDGRPPIGSRSDGGNLVFWFDLAAGQPAQVELREGSRTLSWLGAPPAYRASAIALHASVR